MNIVRISASGEYAYYEGISWWKERNYWDRIMTRYPQFLYKLDLI